MTIWCDISYSGESLKGGAFPSIIWWQSPRWWQILSWAIQEKSLWETQIQRNLTMIKCELLHIMHMFSFSIFFRSIILKWLWSSICAFGASWQVSLSAAASHFHPLKNVSSHLMFHLKKLAHQNVSLQKKWSLLMFNLNFVWLKKVFYNSCVQLHPIMFWLA